MQYYSLHKQAPNVSFKEATLYGQALDKGLYFPKYIPKLNPELIANIDNFSNEAIAYEVMKPYVGDTLTENELQQIVGETINFPIPLVNINDTIASLELFHGPTLAFKDVGARFMSRCLGHFAKGIHKKVVVLVATSGDTGAAVANGFYDIDGVEVVILYPSGKVSEVQEKQLTTLGKNITALEVKGSFDDCQAIVKQIFATNDLQDKLFLTSANSINVARWLPQQLYYFLAYKQLADKNNVPAIVVPSGNFGNICSGILAMASGLPFNTFIAATNVNDTVPNYFATQQYTPKQTVATISNAMDVANPSNFVRVLEIFENQFQALSKHVSSYKVTDDETKQTMLQVYAENGYMLDPHGAVAYKVAADYIKANAGKKAIILETAHPLKFYDVVEPLLNKKIDMPEHIEKQMALPKKSIVIEANAKAVTDILASFA
jgi:threonine synthase